MSSAAAANAANTNNNQHQGVTGQDSYQIEPLAVNVTDIRTAILLLQAPETDVVPALLEWVTKYADESPKHRMQLLSLKVINDLLRLASSKSVDIRKAAVAAIASVTELNDAHTELQNKDLITKLISLLNMDEPIEVLEEAAYALSSIAKDYSNKVEIRKGSGIPALIKVLSSLDPDVKKNTAHALAVLLDDYNSRVELRLQNGFPALLECLVSEYNEIIENALQALYKASDDAANRAEIRKHGGIKKLLDLLNKDAGDIVNLALLVISNCLEDNDTNLSMPDNNGITPIVQLLNHSELRIKVNAFLCLWKIAKPDKNQGYLREAGALTQLLGNLPQLPAPTVPGGIPPPLTNTNISANDAVIISHAILALSPLIKNEMTQNDLIKVGAVDVFTRLLSLEDNSIKRNALLAMTSCGVNAKMRARVRALDGIKYIVNLVQTHVGPNGDIEILVNAIDCLAAYAEDDRMETVKYGGIHALVAALKHVDERPINAACVSLARNLQDDESRAQFFEAQGVNKICELLKSENREIATNASWAVSTAASSEPIALEACHVGALDSLLRLSRYPNRKLSKFASEALEKLLNLNLSAKYWLRNNLSVSNIIKDGFYDLGYAGPNPTSVEAFPQLNELRSLPVDTKREVLLIDRTSDATLLNLLTLAKSKIDSAPAPTDDPFLLPHLQRAQHVDIVAKVVADAMGGCHTLSSLKHLSIQVPISELKLKIQSNVLPIGSIEHGIFYHRALLFKTLVDGLGVSGGCTLIRGEYGRAWNTVWVKNYGGRLEDVDLQEYVVDLMVEPGRLMKVGTMEAQQYQRI